MDMRFNYDAWPLGQAPGAEPGGDGTPLDWHGLRARFLAALACRQLFEGGVDRHSGPMAASFDRSAARALAQFIDVSHAVNLEDSGDGKGLCHIEDGVAGAPKHGDRG